MTLPSVYGAACLRIGCVAWLLVSIGCDSGTPGVEAGPAMQVDTFEVGLTDFRLPVHIAAKRERAADRPLVIFATGDGGWRAVDQELYGAIVRLGYRVAGFSASDYLRHLDRLPDLATPQHVAMDYARVIAAVRAAMDVPDAVPTILTGFSRGAALSVIAAGETGLQGSLAGAVVMGLGDQEEHVWVTRQRAQTSVDHEMLEPYAYLRKLRALPLSIIQSTHDRYLDAAAARRLFGADTDRRRLVSIDATSHTFGGARERLVAEVERSLAWIGRLAPA